MKKFNDLKNQLGKKELSLSTAVSGKTLAADMLNLVGGGAAPVDTRWIKASWTKRF